MKYLPRIPVLLLDVDEVLADFVGAAFALHNVERAAFYARHPPGQWSITDTLGVSLDEFWKRIRGAGADFWAELQPLPWMPYLLLLAQESAEVVYLVSAPDRHASSYDGKLRWIQTHLGPKFHDYVLTEHKSLFARPGSVLIDDREETVLRFAGPCYGGAAILFPSRHNRLCPLADDPLPYVAEQLKELRHALKVS